MAAHLDQFVQVDGLFVHYEDDEGLGDGVGVGAYQDDGEFGEGGYDFCFVLVVLGGVEEEFPVVG